MEPFNHVPIANAGENITISTAEIPTTIIQGAATDEDTDDVLEYQWKIEETVLLDWSTVGQNGECPLGPSNIPSDIGTHTLTLKVRDGQVTSSNDMILTIENSAPHAAPNGCGVYEINTLISLLANVSDFDGDSLDYLWKEGTAVLCSGTIDTITGGLPVELSSCEIADLNLGVHNIAVQVDDHANSPVTADCEVTIPE